MSESTTPKISRDLERIRNAERLARALRPYLSEPFEPQCLSTPATARGRNKDKRICQLNAAYRYCLALEQKVHELYGKENSVPEQFRLVHSTIASNRSEFTPQLDDDIFQTPVQKNSLSNDEPVSSSVCSSANIDAPVPTKRPSILSTISPICGPQDHFIDDSTEIDFAVKKRRVEEKVSFGQVSGSKSAEPDQLNNLEFRKHYFLRSTAIRIKNALSGVSGESEKCARRTNSRKTNSSTHSSSRSSSVTTTSPEIRDEALDVSSLQNIDHAQLLKVDLPPEQLNNLYNLATNDTNSNFNFD
ncbi:hypothetical protein BpHYR1_007249 [Brachionus plicatilis]|uniref:Uncharacterized protein n=1 Tax=Brachionus plicatilis TaxID=10195 RepID=A0A3M7T7U5_BRAPC|nr:hypothetical protein BpHYR1_007249 [Brachionus plicatilis]